MPRYVATVTGVFEIRGVVVAESREEADRKFKTSGPDDIREWAAIEDIQVEGDIIEAHEPDGRTNY